MLQNSNTSEGIVYTWCRNIRNVRPTSRCVFESVHVRPMITMDHL